MKTPREIVVSSARATRTELCMAIRLRLEKYISQVAGQRSNEKTSMASFGEGLPSGYVVATYRKGRRGSETGVSVQAHIDVKQRSGGRTQYRATLRAEGWLRNSREPTGLLLAGESCCAVDLSRCL